MASLQSFIMAEDDIFMTNEQFRFHIKAPQRKHVLCSSSILINVCMGVSIRRDGQLFMLNWNPL